MTLDEIGVQLNVDKSRISHCYCDIYERLMKDKKVLKVLEIGILSGNSLRMWRDFFPWAQVYGIDVNPSQFFQEDRITCIIGDQMDKRSLVGAGMEIGGNIDLIIDDGNHDPIYQAAAVPYLFPFLSQDGVYVIEDIYDPTYLIENLSQYNPRIIVTHKGGDSTLCILERR